VRVLVTGASGFCGTHLLRKLNQEGVEIFTHGPEQAISGVWYNTPIEDLDQLTAVINQARPDFVLHLAGIANTAHFPLYYLVNTLYAANLLRSLELANLETVPVLLVGTSAEYGMVTDADLPITEDLPARPYNHYGISKLAQTGLGLEVAKAGRPIVIARPFNIIGPGMGPQLVVQSIARQIVSIQNGTQPPVIKIGNVASSRDFVDVRDVVDVYWRLVQAPAAYGEIVNVCSGIPVSIRIILDQLLEIAGIPIDVEVDPERVKPVDVPRHFGSTEKLKRLTGFVPARSLIDTLQEVLSQLGSGDQG